VSGVLQHLEKFMTGEGGLADEEEGQAQACAALARCYEKLEVGCGGAAAQVACT